MIPDDITVALAKLGWPPWIAASVAIIWLVADKLKLWPSPKRKSREELLNADEETFRRDLLKMVEQVQNECRKLRAELIRCEVKHNQAVSWILNVQAMLRVAGFEDMPELPPELAILAAGLPKALGEL